MSYEILAYACNRRDNGGEGYGAHAQEQKNDDPRSHAEFAMKAYSFIHSVT
jgi:hypothetical protein